MEKYHFCHSQRIPLHLICCRTFPSETISCIENTEVGWSSMLGQGVPTPTHFMSAQRESEVPLEVWWLGWLQSYLFTTDNKKAPSPEPGIHCPSPGFSPFSGSPCQLGLVHPANLGSSAMKCKTPFYNPCGQLRASDRKLTSRYQQLSHC